MLFTFLPLFPNKTQTLSSPYIVCVGLGLCSRLFGYKFVLICGGVALILNLILIMVTKFFFVQLDPCGLVWTPMMGWVKLDFFEPIMVYWIFLNLFGRENHGEKTKKKKKNPRVLEFNMLPWAKENGRYCQSHVDNVGQTLGKVLGQR